MPSLLTTKHTLNGRPLIGPPMHTPTLLEAHALQDENSHWTLGGERTGGRAGPDGGGAPKVRLAPGAQPEKNTSGCLCFPGFDLNVKFVNIWSAHQLWLEPTSSSARRTLLVLVGYKGQVQKMKQTCGIFKRGKLVAKVKRLFDLLMWTSSGSKCQY